MGDVDLFQPSCGLEHDQLRPMGQPMAPLGLGDARSWPSLPHAVPPGRPRTDHLRAPTVAQEFAGDVALEHAGQREPLGHRQVVQCYREHSDKLLTPWLQRLFAMAGRRLGGNQHRDGLRVRRSHRSNRLSHCKRAHHSFGGAPIDRQIASPREQVAELPKRIGQQRQHFAEQVDQVTQSVAKARGGDPSRADAPGLSGGVRGVRRAPSS